MPTLYDHRATIARKVRSISPDNSLLCAIDNDGDLITDEMVGHSSYFDPKTVREQIQFRGGMSAVAIEEILLLRA